MNRLVALPAAVALAFAGTVGLQAQDAPEMPGQAEVSRVTAGTYATDPAHSIIGWQVSHFGFNDYFGQFGDAEGTLNIDPDNLSAAAVDITVPITSVAVVSEGLADHLLRAGEDGADPDFFGPSPAPARFISTSVNPIGPMEAVVTGNLTMNGTTQPVSILTTFTGAGDNPMSGAETIGFHGRTTISRSDFGVDYAVPFVSDEVELTISVAFEKQD